MTTQRNLLTQYSFLMTLKSDKVCVGFDINPSDLIFLKIYIQ